MVGQFHIYTHSYICEYGNYKYRKNQSNKLEATMWVKENANGKP